MVLVAAGCGSTGTDSSGTGDDDDGSTGGFSCSSFTPGAGIVCDSSTNPPTIRVDFGTGANQAVPGDDPRLAAIDPNKGKYISSFTPTVGTEAIGGMLIKNPATGRIGIRAADELCKAKNSTFTNAHMCSVDEVFWNVRNGFIAAGAQGLALGHYQDPGLAAPRNSFKGNCANLTYNSADLSYTGSRWTVAASDPKAQADGDANNDNLAAIAFNVEGGLACNTTAVPIACCQ
jgi:hypothetical protein